MKNHLKLAMLATAFSWALVGSTCLDDDYEDCEEPAASCRRTLPPTASLLIKVSEPLPTEEKGLEPRPEKVPA